MKQINYKSDFDFILPIADCKGNDIGFPEFDFTIKLWTSSKANSFSASCVNGECLNCFNDDGKLHIVVNRHHLGPGTLKAEIFASLPDALYPDGTRDICCPQELGISLVIGTGDCGTAEDIGAIMPHIKGDKGDKVDAFTYEDFTPEQIAELQKPALEACRWIELAGEVENVTVEPTPNEKSPKDIGCALVLDTSANKLLLRETAEDGSVKYYGQFADATDYGKADGSSVTPYDTANYYTPEQ